MNEQKKGVPGAIFVQKLNITVPGAPLPDYVSSGGAKYWSWSSMGSYQSGVFAALMEEVKKLAKQHGIDVIPFKDYPMLPPYPVASISVDGNQPMFSETALTRHGEDIVANVLLFVQTYVEKKEGKMGDYKIPCGKIEMESQRAGAADSSSTRILTPGKECRAGDLCKACAEIIRLRNLVDELSSPEDAKRAAALGRLQAVVRDISLVEVPTQDPKYVIISGVICNAKTKEPIPADEPIMIFRAKDWAAHGTIVNYSLNFQIGTPHFAAVRDQAQRFAEFQKMYPDRMKRADT